MRFLPIFVGLAISASAGEAQAEEEEADAAIVSFAPNHLLVHPEIGPRLKLSVAIKTNLNQYSNLAAFQLGEMTLGMVDMRFDLQKKRGRVNLGGGDPNVFRLHIDSNVILGKGRARVQAKVDLAIAGMRWQVDIPDVDLDSESVSGERAVTLTLPLIEGNF